MTTDLTKSDLAAILSALDGQPRQPANKAKAIHAIERHAHRLGLTTQEVLEAAPGLLDGRIAPDAWRHQRHQQARAKADSVAAEVVAGIKAERAVEQAEETAAPHEAPEPQDEASNAPEAAPAAESEATPRRQREGSKQATLIAMLRRPEGADLDEIAEALNWRKHTIRGVISGALKKKLGLEVTSKKDAQGRRTYKITEAATKTAG